MWKPKKITTISVEMDLSSSGQENRQVTELYFDDVLFCNACELCRLDETEAQFIICDQCGMDRCEPGNWLTVRRIMDQILFVPAFEAMSRVEWDHQYGMEFQPPQSVYVNGVIRLRRDQYNDIQPYFREVFDLSGIPLLTNREIVQLVQFEAPYLALGKFPDEIKMNRDLYLATDSKVEDEILDVLDSALKRMIESDSFAEPVAVTNGTKVSIFLDTSDFIEWSPLIEVDGSLYLKFGDDWGFLV